MAYDEPLLDEHKEKKPIDKKRVLWTLITMVTTFLVYASYHMTRKIPSAVTSVLDPSNDKASTWNVSTVIDGKTCTNQGWAPFNSDADPLVVNKVGLTVSNTTGDSNANGNYDAVDASKMYATFTKSTSPSDPIITYCTNQLVTTCKDLNSGALFSGWAIGSNVSAEVGCDSPYFNIWFAANTTSPVATEVGSAGWLICEGAGSSPSPIVVPDGEVTIGTELWGDMITLYLGFYALGLFVSGHIADRMNLKLFLSIGMGGSALTVALVGMGYYFNVQTAAYYWVVFAFQGLFQATGWPAVVAITGPWLGKGKRGLAMGIWNAHTSVGNIMGNVVGSAGLSISMGELDCQNNWPMAFIVAGIAMTGVNVLMLIVLKSKPSYVGLEDYSQEEKSEELTEPAALTDDEEQDAKSKRPTFIRALCVPGLIEFAVCLFFCKLVAYTFIYWGPKYVQHGGMDPVSATKYSSFLDYGGIIGGIGAGFLADLLKTKAWVAFGCLLGGIAALYIFRTSTANISESQLTEYKLLMMMVGMFVNAPYALITTAVSADLGTTTKGDEGLMATVTGIIDGTGSVGAAIQGALIGYVSTKYGWTEVFYLLMIFLGISALCLVRLVVRDTKELCCKDKAAREGE